MRRRRNPPADDFVKASRWYHGTDNERAAKGIAENGIRPGDLTNVDNNWTKKGGMLKPVVGRVYMTRSLEYGAIYAIGGSFVGYEMPDDFAVKEPFGYLFVIDGQNLGEVQPDEDSVGEAVGYALKFEKRSGDYPYQSPLYKAVKEDLSLRGSLIRIAKSTTTENRLRMVADGLVAYQAQLGKQMMKVMPDDLKQKLIRSGAHVAHGGAVVPVEGWVIEKKRSIDLKHDASNFFQVAKQFEVRQ